jgi:hypothetical protein
MKAERNDTSATTRRGFMELLAALAAFILGPAPKAGIPQTKDDDYGVSLTPDVMVRMRDGLSRERSATVDRRQIRRRTSRRWHARPSA